MIRALLAILGVPIWLVVGGLAGALLLRRRTMSQPEVVRMKLRPVDAGRRPRTEQVG